MTKAYFAAILVLLSTSTIGAQPSAAPTSKARRAQPFGHLTDSQRKTIDRWTAEIPPRRWPHRPESELIGSLLSWSVSHTRTPLLEETRRSQSAMDALVEVQPTLKTPSGVNVIFQRLVDELPHWARPSTFSFRLTVLDVDEWRSGTFGGGQVFLTRGYLEAIGANDGRQRDRLAFVLAHELGHGARFHCRRAYQIAAIQEHLTDRLKTLESDRARRGWSATVKTSGKLLNFVYGKQEVYEADLFALHLCRNAGFNVENCLDVLRGWTILERETSDGNGVRLAGHTLEGIEGRDCTATVPAANRLRELRVDLDGTTVGDDFGLLRYDDATGNLVPMRDGELDGAHPAVVMIHGMESDLSTYATLMEAVHNHRPTASRPVLGFQYPNDQSLARTGEFLRREIARVTDDPGSWDFVCHSAGGLVFRYYAEVRHGSYRRVLFQGSPHGGSDLALLRFVLETTQILGDLKGGFPTALRNSILDGRGQISFDLTPDSLFLRFVNRQSREADRYHIIRGLVLSRWQKLLLDFAVRASRKSLVRALARTSRSGPLYDWLSEGISAFRIPSEVTRGDLAVSLLRGGLPNVATLETVRLNHMQLTGHPTIVRRVLSFLEE